MHYESDWCVQPSCDRMKQSVLINPYLNLLPSWIAAFNCTTAAGISPFWIKIIEPFCTWICIHMSQAPGRHLESVVALSRLLSGINLLRWFRPRCPLEMRHHLYVLLVCLQPDICVVVGTYIVWSSSASLVGGNISKPFLALPKTCSLAWSQVCHTGDTQTVQSEQVLHLDQFPRQGVVGSGKFSSTTSSRSHGKPRLYHNLLMHGSWADLSSQIVWVSVMLQVLGNISDS